MSSKTMTAIEAVDRLGAAVAEIHDAEDSTDAVLEDVTAVRAILDRMHRHEAILDVLDERERHDASGYTDEHDDDHGPDELLELADEQAWHYRWSSQASRPDRARLVKALSLGLAALETLDRQTR
ncbi:hypothetical protein GA0004736_3393 [Curtobacterium sp. 9128]|uniref:hypothetical protein n=1 Tax=Curtobacterium sp. 9128 TaxID=1793722 RepID=UPI0007D7103F|nr:hypothetical protein [Curtobacterium sp. 9128]SBN64433.1 hypothetical protein GA0004736_3393 [Curtobacterium sp. 9128]